MSTQLKNTREIDYQSFSIPNPDSGNALTIRCLLPIQITGEEKFLFGVEYTDHGTVSFLVRTAADGELDRDFGQAGYASLSPVREDSPSLMSTQVVEIQESPDGSILVLGTALFANEGRAHRTFMTRLLPDGIIDRGFGDEGYFVFDQPIPPGHDGGAIEPEKASPVLNAETLQVGPRQPVNGAQGGVRVGSFNQRSDGTIYLTACIVVENTVDSCWPFLVKLTPEGHYDPTFNSSGYVPLATLSYVGVSPINLIPQGLDYEKFVISSYQIGSLTDRAFVARYLSNGNVDRSFGQSGFVPFPSAPMRYHKLEELSDHSIIVASQMFPVEDYRIGLSKITADGQFDISFNGGRPLIVASPTNGFLMLRSFFCDSDRNITLAGLGDEIPGHEDAVIIRRLPNGLADTGFGDNGFAFFKFETEIIRRFNQIEPRPSDGTQRRFIATTDTQVILFQVPALE